MCIRDSDILCGWMTEKDALAFQQDIQNDDKIFCLIEDQHAPTNKKPPTKLKNLKLFQPFEMYVKMYGLPAYNEMDQMCIRDRAIRG